MKKIIFVITCLLAGCASGNYYGDAGKVYTGDKGYVHIIDSGGVWHAIPLEEPVKPLPECDHNSASYDMDKCLDNLQLKQH